MTSQVFYRKWRPRTLAEVAGQEHITQTLLNALASGRIAHAYLFAGPRGTGKTSTGRILAKAVNCLTSGGKGEPCTTCPMCQATQEGRAMDLIEIDAASNRGIDEIRSLREKAYFVPQESRYKIYIIDEAHMLTRDAANAFLKILEEPPKHVVFVLATTEPEKLPPTIVSRCQRYDFRRLSLQAISQRLQQIARGEGIETSPEVIRLVARGGQGSLRDATNLLERLVVTYGSHPTLEQAQNLFGMTSMEVSLELAASILRRDGARGLDRINRSFAQGQDLQALQRETVEHLRLALLLKSGVDPDTEAPREVISALTDLLPPVSLDYIVRALKLFAQANQRPESPSPLPLELATVESIAAEPVPESQPAPAPREREAIPIAKRPAGVGVGAEPAPALAQPPSASTAHISPPQVPDPVLQHPEPSSRVDLPNTTPSPAETGGDGASTEVLARLRANWRNIISDAPPHLKATKGIAFLRQSCEPVAIQGNAIVLAFRHPVHKENVEKAENRTVVEELISGFLGKPWKVRCILASEGSEGQPQQARGYLVKTVKEMGAKVIEERRHDEQEPHASGPGASEQAP